MLKYFEEMCDNKGENREFYSAIATLSTEMEASFFNLFTIINSRHSIDGNVKMKRPIVMIFFLLFSHFLTKVDSKLGDSCEPDCPKDVCGLWMGYVGWSFSCGSSLNRSENRGTMTAKCLFRSQVCDGFPDCPEGQDEEEFACGLSCPSGEYYSD